MLQAKDIVLGLLMQGPKSGYDIKQEYEIELSHFFDASYGSVYPALKQLEKSGMIVKETVMQDYQAQIKAMQQGIDYLKSDQGHEFWEMPS
ncbi:PadR family transcriptional regulator [Paenibacillus sp. MER TA 81-3]|uniref:PadR family transcriptional regulator n=1 Tax=Paenibacillus sp. MER TA 81-3 TaxID=2939573 RepID=UPI00203FCF1E|nr:PadR family transcriptional regulator [Paenibacillus sp. MER TA 81-3]MCM3338595.1 PadR family transcriptional regulator [Paenibacillus sp. MER TA 81-3]